MCTCVCSCCTYFYVSPQIRPEWARLLRLGSGGFADTRQLGSFPRWTPIEHQEILGSQKADREQKRQSLVLARIFGEKRWNAANRRRKPRFRRHHSRGFQRFVPEFDPENGDGPEMGLGLLSSSPTRDEDRRRHLRQRPGISQSFTGWTLIV